LFLKESTKKNQLNKDLMSTIKGQKKVPRLKKPLLGGKKKNEGPWEIRSPKKNSGSGVGNRGKKKRVGRRSVHLDAGEVSSLKAGKRGGPNT